jgi:hypothetical protein
MSEAKPSFLTSRQQREAQVSPKGRERGCPFLAPSFRQVKEGDNKKVILKLTSFIFCVPKKRTKKRQPYDIGRV